MSCRLCLDADNIDWMSLRAAKPSKPQDPMKSRGAMLVLRSEMFDAASRSRAEAKFRADDFDNHVQVVDNKIVIGQRRRSVIQREENQVV